MPDILLFGATGYTGRLTTQVLAERGADFAIAGRDRDKLEQLARSNGKPETRVVSVGDIETLTKALEDVKVLVTCVGPFMELGDTAAEAALRAGVHYIDSTGESAFIERLLSVYDRRAREAGITMAPALGFDEVPADSAATLACAGMIDAEVVLTYALPTAGSRGTVRSALGIISRGGTWIENGARKRISVGERTRWSPMPPPLGPKLAVGFPLAETQLAPLHLDLRSLQTYVTTGPVQRNLMRVGLPLAKLVTTLPPGQRLARAVIDRMPEGPSETQRRGRWTILAEARTTETWRNVAITGADVYGITAQFLSTGALRLAQEQPRSGVVSPVEAVGIETWQKEFADRGVSVETYEQR